MVMPLRSLLPLALLLLPSLLHAQGRIPELHATAFSGDAVNLPQGLEGHTAVLIVAFSQGSRDAVTGWSRRIAADYRSSPTVLYYEMPVLAAIPRFLRGVVLGQIKKDVPPRAKPRFVPILDHEDEWKTAVSFGRQESGNLPGPNDAYLLVVDGSGTIRSRMAGPAPDDRAYAELKRRLESIKP